MQFFTHLNQFALTTKTPIAYWGRLDGAKRLRNNELRMIDNCEKYFVEDLISPHQRIAKN